MIKIFKNTQRDYSIRLKKRNILVFVFDNFHNFFAETLSIKIEMRSFVIRVGSCLMACFLIGIIIGYYLSREMLFILSWQVVLISLLVCASVFWGLVLFFSEWLLAPLFYWFRRVSTLPIGKVVGPPADVKRMTEWYFLRDHFAYMRQTIDSQHRELQQKTLESQEAHQLKVDFIKNMSHHLRTPLNSLLGACRLLNEGESSQELQKIAFCNAQDISNLIENLMTLAEIDSAMLRFFPQWVHLNELLDQALKEVAQTMGLSYQKLPLKLSPVLSKKIFYDPNLLRRMISVLTRTCLRSFPKGVQSIHSFVDGKHFVFSVETEERELIQENLDKLLERFPPISVQYLQQYPLLSINLCLVKELAEFCEGSLSITLAHDQGLRLDLRLPLNQEIENTEEAWDLLEEDLKQVESDDPISNKQSYKILIAEDNQENQFIFEQYLKHRPDTNYHIIFASDGVQAVQKVLSEKPDLVMMDIMMPNMDGIKAAKKIKDTPPFQEIPLIAMTSMALAEDRELIEPYVDAYLTKPVMVEALYQTLDHHLKSS